MTAQELIVAASELAKLIVTVERLTEAVHELNARLDRLEGK